MNKDIRYFLFTIAAMGLLLLQSCELIADIFTAGFWVGIVLTILVIAVIIWLIVKATQRFRRK